MGDAFLNKHLINREVKDVIIINSLACGIVAVEEQI